MRLPTALAACATEGHHVAVAVTDVRGQLRFGVTADGAASGRIYQAAQKAVTAAACGLPTSVVQQRLRDDPAAAAKVAPDMALFPGAVPLFAGAWLIGAIGVSGGTAPQDEVCAAAGAKKAEVLP